jgi:hypothetical protein
MRAHYPSGELQIRVWPAAGTTWARGDTGFIDGSRHSPRLAIELHGTEESRKWSGSC